MASDRVGREAGRFQVRIKSTDASGMATNALYRRCNRMGTAYAALVEIIQQWSALQGALPPGTSASIVDMHDGGTVLKLEHLGFEANLFTGR